MPTYEYACTKCGHHFEHFQSMKDAPLKKCPKCGKPALKRLVGAGAGLIFKGSGFYITDYRSQSYTDAAKKDAPAKPDSGAKKESGTKDAVSKSEKPGSSKKPKPD